MAKRVETFSFDSEADKDIARWLAGLPSRGKSAAIRAATTFAFPTASMTPVPG